MKNLLSRELRIVNRQWSIVNDYTLNTQHSTKKQKNLLASQREGFTYLLANLKPMNSPIPFYLI